MILSMFGQVLWPLLPVELERFGTAVQVGYWYWRLVVAEVRSAEADTFEEEIFPHVVVGIIPIRSNCVKVPGTVRSPGNHFFGHELPNFPSDQKSDNQIPLIEEHEENP